VAQSPVRSADTASSMVLKRSMQFLTRQLDERTEELSNARVELNSKTNVLLEVREERDKCMTALEEAHECVSDYHRKLSAMERTVGNALVCKGEIKDLTNKLDESKRLNTQYREALAAAEMRIESLQNKSASQQESVQTLESDVAAWKSKAECTSYQASESSKRAQELDILTAELKTRLADAEGKSSTLSEQFSELEARHNETLAALSDLITIQKRSDAEREQMAESLQTQQRCIAQHQVRHTNSAVVSIMQRFFLCLSSMYCSNE
jgi:chromosome segregation ATPase